ncbi:hypothetical protein GCM10018952_33160 [Streptosporangium vulgare]
MGNDGLLHVGPASAGADPGPVCYGRGGTQPTVTDANLVMGRLHPDHFLGGELTLDAERAGTAVAELADSLELGVDAAAEAVLTLAVENMAGAVRLVTVDRGHDYREFDLVAFGGAGPLHAAAIARHMRMRRVIVPPTPGLVSAFGTIISDQRVDRRMTAVRRLDAPEATDLAGILARLAREAHAELAAQRRADATGDIVVTTYVSCRYVGQNYEQEIRTYRGHLDRSYESLLPGLSGRPGSGPAPGGDVPRLARPRVRLRPSRAGRPERLRRRDRPPRGRRGAVRPLHAHHSEPADLHQEGPGRRGRLGRHPRSSTARSSSRATR